VKAKAQIFLSYAREDKEEVAKLYQRLSEVGLKPWMDIKDILPGEKWQPHIQKAIRNSDFFMACLSPNSVKKRGFIQVELKEALDIWQEKLDSDIYLIPIRLKPCEMPESLSDFQWADLFKENGWALVLKAIQEGMKRQRKMVASDGNTGQQATSPIGATQLLRRGTFSDFLLTPPGGWTGVIVLLGVGVVGELVATLVGLTLGSSLWLLGLSVVSAVALLGSIYWVQQQSKPRVLVPEDEQPIKHRGLIVLVGIGRPGEDPMRQSAGAAIEYHIATGQEAGLETCWLIATGGESGSLPIAYRLQEACRSRNITTFIRTVADPFSLQETYDVVQRIYTEEVPKAGLSEHEVIADFTGGVKPMSAGMILACGDHRPMQYMTGRKGGIASVPKLVRFTPRTSANGGN
jgi:hypothetical protein